MIPLPRVALLVLVVLAGCASPVEAPSSTTGPVVTTDPPASTTTTEGLGASDVVAFVDDFSGWLAVDDVESLFASLHPYVVERGGAAACRSFIADQIVRFEDYRATGEPFGPTPLRFPEGDAEVWTVPVSFVYEGEPFEAEAVVSVESGEGRWFTECP